MKSNGAMTRMIFGLFTFTVLSGLHLTLADTGEDGGHLTPVWIIRGGTTQNCTLIAMDTTIQHPVFKDVKSSIPADAEVVGGETVSECNNEFQEITLAWRDDGYSWEITLRFEVTDESYALTNFSGNVTDEESGLSPTWSYREYSYPSAPTSNSIECNLLIVLGGRFENVSWQPFAQNTDGDFGPGYQCEILATSGGVKFIFFLILSLTVVIALVISLFNRPARK